LSGINADQIAGIFEDRCGNSGPLKARNLVIVKLSI